jgi:hypothetical protein
MKLLTNWKTNVYKAMTNAVFEDFLAGKERKYTKFKIVLTKFF